MNNKIGELIEKYRKEKGLTQDELGRRLGVTNKAVSKWEVGETLPDVTIIRKDICITIFILAIFE